MFQDKTGSMLCRHVVVILCVEKVQLLKSQVPLVSETVQVSMSFLLTVTASIYGKALHEIACYSRSFYS